MHSCILSITEKQHMKRVDTCARNMYPAFVPDVCVCQGQTRRMSWQLRSSSRTLIRIKHFAKNSKYTSVTSNGKTSSPPGMMAILVLGQNGNVRSWNASRL